MVTREARPGGGRLVLRRDGAEAQLTWITLAPGRIAADHTGVPEALRGTGAGLALVQRLVEMARAEGLRVEPRCSFVAAQARRHPDWADVFAPLP
ncbi:MAG: GNAT family N-acetyltransferase [Gemmobacter sp.]